MVSVFSVNVNGLNDTHKRNSIFSWVKNKNADILLLQETHCGSNSISNIWGKEWGGLNFWNNHNSRKQGVAILFRKGFQYDVEKIEYDSRFEGRLISLAVKTAENKTYLISSLYAPNVASELS